MQICFLKKYRDTYLCFHINLVNVKTQTKYVNSTNVCGVHSCQSTALTLLAFLEFGLVWDEQCPSFSNP